MRFENVAADTGVMRLFGVVTICAALMLCAVGCSSTAETAPAPSQASSPAPAKSAAQAAWDAELAGYLAASRNEHDHRIANWQTVESWSFDDGAMPEGFRVFSGEWAVQAGRLVATDGEYQGNRVIGIARCQWPAFRMSFDAMVRPHAAEGERAKYAGLEPARVGDIGVRINADPQTASFADGYAIILAHYGNQANVIHRLNIPWVRNEWPIVEAGRVHRVMVEVVRPHIRVWVDGKVVLDGWERHGQGRKDDSDFLAMDPERLLALHTYDSELTVDNIVIETPVAK